MFPRAPIRHALCIQSSFSSLPRALPIAAETSIKRQARRIELTPCLVRRSLERAAVITFLLTWEGAEKCALRHLRRDEDTDALNFIAAARTKRPYNVRLGTLDKPHTHVTVVSRPHASSRAAPAQHASQLPPTHTF